MLIDCDLSFLFTLDIPSTESCFEATSLNSLGHDINSGHEYSICLLTLLSYGSNLEHGLLMNDKGQTDEVVLLQEVLAGDVPPGP